MDASLASGEGRVLRGAESSSVLLWRVGLVIGHAKSFRLLK